MALRKSIVFACCFFLVLLTGIVSTHAQNVQGQPERRTEDELWIKRSQGIKTPDLREKQGSMESLPGSRQVTVTKGAPQQNALLKGASKPLSGAFPPPKYKTSGREFYVVFPSVKGSGTNTMDPAKRSLYLTSRSRTKVKVSYILRNWEREVVTVPGQMTIVELPEWGVLNARQFENVFDLGIRIEAQDDIAVYGYSHEVLSTDGFLVLPKEALGQHYVVASTRNALNYGDYTDDYFPRSTFVMMGTEDNTQITFRLSATSQSRRLLKDSEYTVVLNRGEVYPVFARDTGIVAYYPYKMKIDDTTYITFYERYYAGIYPGVDCDLTGSEIRSDKPIAVYCGHERAATPPEIEIDVNQLFDTARGVSRDHLTEQVPPVELWGSEFIVMASVQDRDNSRPMNGDLVRIISAEDDNAITINGVAAGTIGARKFHSFFNNGAAHVVTSKPALVLKYAQSRKNRSSIGDPDMTIVPPISNLSMKYTLPVVNNNLVFLEAFVNVLVHKDAVNQTLINGRPPQTRAKTIPGTNFVWFSEWGSPGEWRIESSLPCYAESYAYGEADGYTFAGGGDFTYLDSLSAENLDFKTLLITKSKQLTSHIKAGYDLNLLADSISIFNVTWLSGDTNHFAMLDTIRDPIRLGPGNKLPFRFNFAPTEVREYRARAWVWSSSRAAVYIDVVGWGGLMTVDITPTTIDFGRVRVGKTVDKQYSVRFYGEDQLAKIGLYRSTYPELASKELGFHLKDVPESFHEGGTAYTERVTFAPETEGWRDTAFTVSAQLPQVSSPTPLRVRLLGRGVAPNVVVADHDFGEMRVNRETAFEEVEIRNMGSDTTMIKSITIEAGPDADDFALDPTSVPSSEHFLDTTDVPKSRYRFRAKFTPNDTGMKSVRVRIETLEQVVYSTLTGRGVEPYIIAVPTHLDFGTYQAPRLPDVLPDPVMMFTIKNIGTYEGLIERLTRTVDGPTYFTMRPLPPKSNVLNEPLAKNDSIQVEVTFHIKEVGEFDDTVSVINDTENQPLVTFYGKVTSGSVDLPTLVLFDTVRDCDPIVRTIVINNQNSVAVSITNIVFGEGSDGFSFAREFLFPVEIPSGGDYELEIKYQFPPDSLSGTQVTELTFTQMVGDEPVEMKVRLEVVRLIRTLTLKTVAPSFVPNVSDAEPFKLPITIEGDHLGLQELDNFDLVLRFNNELFLPVGFTLVGSLMESPGVIIQPTWNEEENTYLIRASNLQVSQKTGDLLITILVRARLTKDTTSVVTPELALTQRPCAYGIEKLGVGLEYADDCGDLFLRDMLVNGDLQFSIQSANPDPLIVASSSAINFNYTLANDATLRCEIIDATGVIVERLEPILATAGEGTLSVPAAKLNASGIYSLRVYQQFEGQSPSVTTKMFRVVR